MLRTFDALVRRLSLAGAILSSLLLIALVGLITVEIVGRSFFDYSTMLADEYSGYFFLALVYLGLAYTFREEGHIRITIVRSRLPEGGRRLLDIFAAALTLAIFLYALRYSWDFMMESKEMEMLSEGVSETPLWLTQIPVVVGLGLFALAVAAYLLRRIAGDR
ncbi:TRAP transporter small permease subunit [Nitratifractor sp.]